MYLKKIYGKDDLERYTREREAALVEARGQLIADGMPEGAVLDAAAKQKVDELAILPPKLEYISLAHTGKAPEQNFSTGLVTDLLKSGLMEISGDELIFHVHPEDLHYEILRTPGRYCLHCDEKLQDDTSGELARLHIAMKHAGVPSPVASEPSGYVALNYFQCVLNNGQHEKFKLTKVARAAQFPRREN